MNLKSKESSLRLSRTQFLEFKKVIAFLYGTLEKLCNKAGFHKFENRTQNMRHVNMLLLSMVKSTYVWWYRYINHSVDTADLHVVINMCYMDIVILF
jgi:hypothetical protein